MWRRRLLAANFRPRFRALRFRQSLVDASWRAGKRTRRIDFPYQNIYQNYDRLSRYVSLLDPTSYYSAIISNSGLRKDGCNLAAQIAHKDVIGRPFRIMGSAALSQDGVGNKQIGFNGNEMVIVQVTGEVVTVGRRRTVR